MRILKRPRLMPIFAPYFVPKWKTISTYKYHYCLSSVNYTIKINTKFILIYDYARMECDAVGNPVSTSRHVPTSTIACLQYSSDAVSVLYLSLNFLPVRTPLHRGLFYTHAIYINNKRLSRKEITNLSTKRYKLQNGTRRFSKTSGFTFSLQRYAFRMCVRMHEYVCAVVNIFKWFRFRLIWELKMVTLNSTIYSEAYDTRIHGKINITCEMSVNCVKRKKKVNNFGMWKKLERWQHDSKFHIVKCVEWLEMC